MMLKKQTLRVSAFLLHDVKVKIHESKGQRLITIKQREFNFKQHNKAIHFWIFLLLIHHVIY